MTEHMDLESLSSGIWVLWYSSSDLQNWTLCRSSGFPSPACSWTCPGSSAVVLRSFSSSPLCCRCFPILSRRRHRWTGPADALRLPLLLPHLVGSPALAVASGLGDLNRLRCFWGQCRSFPTWRRRHCRLGSCWVPAQAPALSWTQEASKAPYDCSPHPRRHRLGCSRLTPHSSQSGCELRLCRRTPSHLFWKLSPCEHRCVRPSCSAPCSLSSASTLPSRSHSYQQSRERQSQGLCPQACSEVELQAADQTPASASQRGTWQRRCWTCPSSSRRKRLKSACTRCRSSRFPWRQCHLQFRHDRWRRGTQRCWRASSLQAWLSRSCP